MNRIPPKIKKAILSDDYYKKCARSNADCQGRITWEHAFTYAGKQIQEVWAIIPLCWYHHLGVGLVKAINQAIAISRATLEDLQKYPRLLWLKHRQLKELSPSLKS